MTTRKSQIIRTTIVFVAFCAVSLPAYADYGGGSGTADDPYQIATAEDLMKLGETPEDYDKHFVLTADIDLDPNLPGRKVFDRAVIPSDWHNPFTGVFDGNGNTISNLACMSEDKQAVGFVGEVDDPNAEIRNLGLLNPYCSGQGRVGSLVGLLMEGNVTSCYALNGSIAGNTDVGGLIGSNAVQGWFGALSGKGGKIYKCFVDGISVGGRRRVGGIVGANHRGLLSNCYSYGTIRGDRFAAGGLVGQNSHHQPASETVPMPEQTGSGTITNCYAACNIVGHQFAGGLVGYNEIGGTIQNCYSMSLLEAESYVGGLVGSNRAMIASSFWDIEASGQTMSDGGTGKTTTEMQTASTFLQAGWDFVGETENGPNDIWKIVEGQTYPLLSWQKYGGGTGGPNDPYLIYTAEHLNDLGAEPNDYDKHFKLMADIDLSGYTYDRAVIAPDVNDAPNSRGWNPPFDGAPFTGVFDGNGHTISHLMIKGVSYLGLFGRLAEWDAKAGVRDLSLEEIDVRGTGDYVGGMIGYNSRSSISNCHSTGSIDGYDYVGGLIGVNYGLVTQCSSTGIISGDGDIGGLIGANSAPGSVTECCSYGLVSGRRTVGGLAGSNFLRITGPHYSLIADSYSTAAVNCESDRCGGLVGDNIAGLLNCYSTGAVRSGGADVGGLVGYDLTGDHGVWHVAGPENGFWDTETSGQTTSAGGTGKATAEMQTASTFLEAGWDFIDETANGTDDIWWILEGQSYPRLTWELNDRYPSLTPFPLYPRDGESEVVLQPLLHYWTSGELQHDVYFGDHWETVAHANTDSHEIYCGRQTAQSMSYRAGVLELNKTYYWRIDEVNKSDPNVVSKGKVWSFRTIDYAMVSVLDDFESYTQEENKKIDDTWVNVHSGPLGITLVYAEWRPVHSGQQSMELFYLIIGRPWYPEAERTWETLQDWTINGANTLTLYFRGEADNTPEPLYVEIEDSVGQIAEVQHPDSDAVLATDWQKWHIAFADLTAQGVNIAEVKKMYIGVGSRDNPQPGGTGRIYVDDIRLTKRMP